MTISGTVQFVTTTPSGETLLIVKYVAEDETRQLVFIGPRSSFTVGQTVTVTVS